MASAAAQTARTAVGIIGNFISFFLFASPCPTFWGILKKKSTEEFKPDPYIVTVMNCLFWIFYGLPLVRPNSILVTTINSIGLVMELAYLTIFFIYTTRRRQMKIVVSLLVEGVFMAGIVTFTLLKLHTHEARSNFVGIFCTIINVLMYASPLTVMRKVIVTKSVEFMPFYLSLANFMNGVIWLTYALIQFDLYIVIGNGLGAMLGAFQLILYMFYNRTTHTKEEDEKPSTVQLSSSKPISASSEDAV